MKKNGVGTKLLRFVWGLIPWLIVACICGFIFVLCGRVQDEKIRLEKAKQAAIKIDNAPVSVITLTLSPMRLVDKINLPGNVAPYEELWVKAEVGGQVMHIPVKEGQSVTKGQILVELDDRDYRLRLSRIEAAYKLAKLEYDRIAALDRKGITAANRMDEASANLKDITAQRDEARLALERTSIEAPIEGRINEIAAKQGDLVLVGAQIAQILQVGKVKVKVGIPESDVTSFFSLKTSEVVIEALGNRRVTGEKVFLSRQPRNLARLFDLELMIPNPDGKILPGMFARVELVRNVYKNALVIPLYAVISQGDESHVFVEKKGRAEKRQVNTGILVDWRVQILSGLEAGDRLVVVGHRLLEEGQAVDVVKNVSSPEEILAQ
ncbi:MAG: efflux RND transporter periplasmic adaptor subunit [Deltaproteobacteria bacterium]|nr:efflux RND transporter periplasmic adaptor subunit [Deltaproteobacteria bacterium]